MIFSNGISKRGEIMKQLNFSTPKILKSLLNKSKATTLRKAWKEISEQYDNEYDKNSSSKRIIDKPCKYNVGETYETVWRKDNECSWFCRKCGGDLTPMMPCCDNTEKPFHKNLGKVKITKIEKINIWKEGNTNIIMRTDRNTGYYGEYSIGDKFDLSKSEGFKNPEEMFEYLEEYSGGLKEVKKFYLVTFKWL